MEDLRIKLGSIAIYGAGNFGHKLMNILEWVDIVPKCFVQTDKDGQIVLDGIPIISVDEMVVTQEEYLVLIAIADKKARENVRNILKEKNYNMSLVYDMSSFIIDNKQHFYDGVINSSNECLLCGNKIIKFEAAGERNPIFLKKKIIGGGFRKNAVCPCCGSIDRNRWVFWVLKNHTDIFLKECTVVHFAPEQQIRNKLESSVNCDYYPGNVIRGGGLHKIDVTDIPYVDKFADYIIINHVMEHVADEEKAIKEMKRILKNDGKIIMSFPISMEQNTFENKAIVSEEDRDKYYGQKDHVRLYGMDYKERFENYGLIIKIFSPKDYFNDADIEKYGLLKDDILMLCSKI